MPISIEEAKAFVVDAEKYRSNWLTMAERSWAEIKKRQRNNRIWSVTPNTAKRRARYPAWFSIFKIRQPLLLSRVGIPIGKDTTQDGQDNVGATAAILLERLAVNLARSFNFFDVLSCARDDFLATNFGLLRAYYEREEVKEKVKEYITPEKLEGSEDIVFIDSKGEIVESDDIGQDDEGFFLEHEETVDVDNERICLEPLLYKDVYIDPGVRRWNRVKRIAFAEYYSIPEFKNIFGSAAYADLAAQELKEGGDSEAKPKNQSVKVFEYWDEYEKEVLYWAENGSKFIKPKGYLQPEDESEEQLNGLYNLEKFFPCPEPLIINAPTDEFWPVPEFYQVVEILEDIHTIFSRMVALTKAIRARLLFDNNVEGLQEALNEASEGDAFGVPNLAQSLVSAGGSLDAVVQYIPVENLINGLNQLYTALEQRLNVLYKLTGTSDLLQGLITDPTQRTFGERQMTEKYALNQIAEPQRKMQEFVRGAYELMCEMALKNFKDASLDRYIVPATLSPDHKARYRQALGMLKDNHKRFRIELETDSTIALNEEYDKQMRIELVNTLTAALEKTANIAQTSPALVTVELHCLKFLIQGFRQGKLFQNEVTQAIDAVIKQVQSQPEPFNKEEADNQLKQRKMALDEMKAVNEANKGFAEVQDKTRRTSIEEFKAVNQSGYHQQLASLLAQKQNVDAEIAYIQSMIDQQKAGVEIEATGVEIQNKLADNERLTAEFMYGVQRGNEPRQPSVVVVPSAPAAPQAPVIVMPSAPVSGPTIINAPNPQPQTSVIQPVQQVPVPIVPTNNF